MTPLGDVLQLCPNCGSHHTYIDHGYDTIAVREPLIIESTEIWVCSKCDSTWTSVMRYVAYDPGTENKTLTYDKNLEMWDQEMIEYLSRFAQ